MTKVVKPKKVKETTLTQPVIEETPIPPSVELEEVKETDKIEPEIKEEVPEPVKEVVLPPIVKSVILNDTMTMDEKIMAFLESRPKGEIMMNDFLKSLFKPPKYGELPTWQNQGANKQVKNALAKLQAQGDIEVMGQAHLKLGTIHYPDTSTMKTVHHDLISITIYARKVN